MIGIRTGITLSGGGGREADFTIVRSVLGTEEARHRRIESLGLTRLVFAKGSTGGFFSAMAGTLVGNASTALCWFRFISLFGRFTRCPSDCSSAFGVRLRRPLSVVESFFVELLLLVGVEPNRRKGEVGIAWKSSVSISTRLGLARSCWEKFCEEKNDATKSHDESLTRCKPLFEGETRLLLSTDSLRWGNNLKVSGRISWPRRKER